MKERPMRRFSLAAGAVAVGLACLLAGHAGAQGGGDGARVLARVNGTPITLNQVNAGVPADAYARRAKAIRTMRLNRLVEQAAVREFLAARKIRISDEQVERRIAQLRKLPPSVGCPCCRFSDLEEYLRVDSITLPELREKSRNELGLDQYLAALWKKEGPVIVRRPVSTDEKERIARTYAKVWHIFFNTYMLPDSPLDPSKVKAQAAVKSQQAWERLQRGTPFAQLAREVTEDRLSRDTGGYLGLVQVSKYGRDFDLELRKLKPGVLGKPFLSNFGYHIARWQPVTAADYPAVYRMEFLEQRKTEIVEKAVQTARVERFD